MINAHKISFLDGNDFIPYRFSNIWDIEKTTGPDRLIIGPSSNHVELMTQLTEKMPDPFGILYVLLVSRAGLEPARYQSPYPCRRNEMEAFLQSFEHYFEFDGRHHIWVTSLSESSTLVYDQHNVIYAYGPLEQFKNVLRDQGLKRGAVSFPIPHAHNYNAQFDDEELRLFEYWDWIKTPLMEDDDL